MTEFRAPNLQILVAGCGGAGSNTVNRISRQRLPAVKTAALNTDARHLYNVRADRLLLLGPKRAHGLGVGGKPEKGMECAQLSLPEIEALVEDKDLVFVACGMGGGTGTGAAPVVAKAARDAGALTVAIACLPFPYEGYRMQRAIKWLPRLAAEVDCLITIENRKILELAPNLPAVEALGILDQLLSETILGITDMVTRPSLINLDFADLKTVLKDSGTATILYAEGPSRYPAEVAANALNNPFLDIDISEATRGLIHITGGPDLDMKSADIALGILGEEMAPGSERVFGIRLDDAYKGTMRVSAIIAGLPVPTFLRPEIQEPEALLVH